MSLVEESIATVARPVIARAVEAAIAQAGLTPDAAQTVLTGLDTETPLKVFQAQVALQRQEAALARAKEAPRSNLWPWLAGGLSFIATYALLERYAGPSFKKE